MTTGTITGEGKIFYGWWIVLVAAIGLSVGYGPIVTFTFGVFFKPLSQEFGWNRAQVSLAFSLSLLVMSVGLPLVGRVVDRLGARKVIVPSVVLFGMGFMSFALLSSQLWLLYAIYIALGVVGGGTAPVPYSNVLSHWFDKQRGLALGVAMVGLGLGAFAMPTVAQGLIDVGGWRWAYVYIGAMVMLIAAPVVALFLTETPQMLGLVSDGMPPSTATASGKPTGLSSQEARQTGTFWVMVGAFFLMSVAIHGCLIHLVPLLTDRGVSPQGAALATSLLGGALLFGRVGAGYLLDCLAASTVAVGFFGGATVGFVLLWSGVSGDLAFLASFLVGLGMGAEGDIIAYLVSRYFGLRAFGEIYGYVFAAFTLGGVVGPLLMGVGFEATGSYRLVLGAFVCASLVAVALMTQLGPYRRWETASLAAATTSS
ncbi:MAG: MFS transporter [Deltaproteobacteria bacterium]|nr:MFS transporter [Deltaproteobacteria bacterium]